jgi:predicted ABC-type ATPase
MSQPHFIIVAGANGSGKSTSAPALLPPSVPYINADEIAKTLTLEAAEGKDRGREASRLLLERWDVLAAKQEDFAIETTLSRRSLASRIQRLQANGYNFT